MTRVEDVGIECGGIGEHQSANDGGRLGSEGGADQWQKRRREKLGDCYKPGEGAGNFPYRPSRNPQPLTL